MELKFRDLRADEIDCRIATIREGSGLSLLLYKDARCDMNILDETVGPMDWQRRHTRENANCIVSIYDKEKNAWIEKEDTGTESYTEKEKGLASDSFKRACFNWGIGRELYTAPFIWIKAADCEIKKENGKTQCFDRFRVESITIQDKKIVALSIINATKGKRCFQMGGAKPAADKQEPKEEPELHVCSECGQMITPITMRGGQTLSPYDIEQNTNKQFGRALCADCWRERRSQK